MIELLLMVGSYIYETGVKRRNRSDTLPPLAAQAAGGNFYLIFFTKVLKKLLTFINKWCIILINVPQAIKMDINLNGY